MSLQENNLEKELRLYKERGKERGKEKQDEEREWMVASESEEIYDMQPYENTRDLETGGEISLETELMHQKYLDNLKGEKKNLDYYRRLNIVLPENQAFADEIMPVWDPKHRVFDIWLEKSQAHVPTTIQDVTPQFFVTTSIDGHNYIQLADKHEDKESSRRNGQNLANHVQEPSYYESQEHYDNQEQYANQEQYENQELYTNLDQYVNKEYQNTPLPPVFKPFAQDKYQEIYPENPGFSPQSNIPLPFNTENSKPSGYNPYPEQNKYSTRPEPTSYNEISNSPVNNVEFSKPSQHQDDIYPVYNSYNDNRKIDIYPDIEANRLEKNSENNDIFMYNQFNSNDSPQNEYNQRHQEYNNQRHQKYNSQPHQEYDSDPHLEYNSGSHQDHFNKFKHNFIMNPDKWVNHEWTGDQRLKKQMNWNKKNFNNIPIFETGRKHGWNRRNNAKVPEYSWEHSLNRPDRFKEHSPDDHYTKEHSLHRPIPFNDIWKQTNRRDYKDAKIKDIVEQEFHKGATNSQEGHMVYQDDRTIVIQHFQTNPFNNRRRNDRRFSPNQTPMTLPGNRRANIRLISKPTWSNFNQAEHYPWSSRIQSSRRSDEGPRAISPPSNRIIYRPSLSEGFAGLIAGLIPIGAIMATFLGAGVGRGRRKREVKDMNRKGEAADAILLESQEEMIMDQKEAELKTNLDEFVKKFVDIDNL